MNRRRSRVPIWLRKLWRLIELQSRRSRKWSKYLIEAYEVSVKKEMWKLPELLSDAGSVERFGIEDVLGRAALQDVENALGDVE